MLLHIFLCQQMVNFTAFLTSYGMEHLLLLHYKYRIEINSDSFDKYALLLGTFIFSNKHSNGLCFFGHFLPLSFGHLSALDYSGKMSLGSSRLVKKTQRYKYRESGWQGKFFCGYWEHTLDSINLVKLQRSTLAFPGTLDAFWSYPWVMGTGLKPAHILPFTHCCAHLKVSWNWGASKCSPEALRLFSRTKSGLLSLQP